MIDHRRSMRIKQSINKEQKQCLMDNKRINDTAMIAKDRQSVSIILRDFRKSLFISIFTSLTKYNRKTMCEKRSN